MTSAQVHERNALTVKGRKLTGLNVIGHFRVPKTFTFKMRLGAQPFSWKWVLFEWEWKMISISKAGGWVSLGKKLEFKSSEMTKNVSISHKVERSFIYFVHYSLWKSYSYWPGSFSESDCLLPLWKVQIVWLEKNLYMDIVALGFDHLMTSLSMVFPQVLFSCLFSFSLPILTFFSQIRTCARP